MEQYEIIEIIGRGASSIVYKAKNKQTSISRPNSLILDDIVVLKQFIKSTSELTTKEKDKVQEEVFLACSHSL